jgi:hypothetical protein
MVYEADPAADFGFGNLIHEFHTAKNLGYAHYLNDIGEAFWTINQDEHRVIDGMRAAFGTAHVVISRNEEAVWRGVLAELAQWNLTFENTEIAGATGRPIDRLWARAVALTDSQLGFASTGTIEAPVTTTDGSTAIVLESYKLYYKRILHAFKELVSIAVSDTTNVCYFELDYGTSPTSETLTFNFWKDNGVDTDIELQYPGLITNFNDRYVPILTRNQILAVGSGARDQLYRNSQWTTAGDYGSATFGRRMEPIYFTWVRDEAELGRVTKRRKAKAIREDINLFVRLQPTAGLLPWRATGSGYELGDRMRVSIDRGITQIDKMMFVEGQQVTYVNGLEYVQPIFADRPGS